MSFTNVGPLIFLAPGQTAYWNYSYPGDRGSQIATADVKIPNLGAVHVAEEQAKRRENNGNATYFVQIRNRGIGGAFHNLQGGGLT